MARCASQRPMAALLLSLVVVVVVVLVCGSMPAMAQVPSEEEQFSMLNEFASDASLLDFFGDQLKKCQHDRVVDSDVCAFCQVLLHADMSEVCQPLNTTCQGNLQVAAKQCSMIVYSPCCEVHLAAHNDAEPGRHPVERLVSSTFQLYAEGDHRVTGHHMFSPSKLIAHTVAADDLKLQYRSLMLPNYNDSFPITASWPHYAHHKSDCQPSKQPIKGFIDTHVHMFGAMSFGGAYIHGSHNDTLELGTGACSGRWDHGMFMGSEHNHDKRRNGFSGFDGWPRFDAVNHQQVHEGWLKEAAQRNDEFRLRAVVLSAVHNEKICFIYKTLGLIPKAFRRSAELYGIPYDKICNDQLNVERQLRAAHELVARNSDWVAIADSPQHCREIIASDKLCVVLAVEVGHPCADSETPEQCVQRYYDLGVRSIQAVHLVTNRFAGAGPVTNIVEVAEILKKWVTKKNVWEKITSIPKLIVSLFEEIEHKDHNPLGLTDEGRRFVRALMDKRMLIDIAHLSKKAKTDVHLLSQENADYPMFLSHGNLQPFQALDKDWYSDLEVLLYILQSGGVVGLRTQGEGLWYSYKKAQVKQLCHGSSLVFSNQYEFIIREFGLPVATGVDFNGMAVNAVPRHYSPERDPQRIFKGDACGSVALDCEFGDIKAQQFAQVMIGDWAAKLIGSGQSAITTLAGKCKRLGFERQAQQELMRTDPLFQRKVGTAFDYKGCGSIEVLPDLIKDLKNLGVSTDCPICLENSAEQFVRMWERAYDDHRAPVQSPVLAMARQNFDKWKSDVLSLVGSPTWFGPFSGPYTSDEFIHQNAPACAA